MGKTADFNLTPKQKADLLHWAGELDGGMTVKGWRRFSSTYRNMNAYYNKSLGLVIKVPAFILEPRTPVEFRVPTIRLDDEWVVQPLVKKTNLKKALTSLHKKMLPYLQMGMCPDLHVGNVGWYKGKPLLFDW